MLRTLARLSDADREALTLLAWHGLTSQEAAQVVGCSRAAFFVRLHRARRRLGRAVRHETGDVPAPRAATRGAMAPVVLPGEELSR